MKKYHSIFQLFWSITMLGVVLLTINTIKILIVL